MRQRVRQADRERERESESERARESARAIESARERERKRERERSQGQNPLTRHTGAPHPTTSTNTCEHLRAHLQCWTRYEGFSQPGQDLWGNPIARHIKSYQSHTHTHTNTQTHTHISINWHTLFNSNQHTHSFCPPLPAHPPPTHTSHTHCTDSCQTCEIWPRTKPKPYTLNLTP
jgi:hypothetical protein